jgi:GTP-binding protein
MFDSVRIKARAGAGGDGAVSFRREKFVPFGGPDGGDGGDGGAVVVVADPFVSSLLLFRQGGLYRAADGKNGRGAKKHGKSGEDLLLSVPVGTIVSYGEQIGSDALIVDLERPGQRVVVARGGRGGWGNTHFASSINQSPRIAQKGESGEMVSVELELRLIADVGIIGYPNVGKSTLLAAASAARPRIADYPFTTREPVLGVVEVGQQSFILAEIPGLIDGAHLGRGLGDDFLRHIVRTKMLIHLIDGSSASPVKDMICVNTELGLFDSALAQKPQVVALNKIDLPQVQTRLVEMRDSFREAGTTVLFVSAGTGEGVSELMTETMSRLQSITAGGEAREKPPRKVFHPQPKRIQARVQRDGNAFILIAPELERVVARIDMTSPEVRWQFKKQLQRLGVGRALEKAGIKPGDKIRCGDIEWEW